MNLTNGDLSSHNGKLTVFAFASTSLGLTLTVDANVMAARSSKLFTAKSESGRIDGHDVKHASGTTTTSGGRTLIVHLEVVLRELHVLESDVRALAMDLELGHETLTTITMHITLSVESHVVASAISKVHNVAVMKDGELHTTVTHTVTVKLGRHID